MDIRRGCGVILSRSYTSKKAQYSYVSGYYAQGFLVVIGTIFSLVAPEISGGFVRNFTNIDK